MDPSYQLPEGFVLFFFFFWEIDVAKICHPPYWCLKAALVLHQRGQTDCPLVIRKRFLSTQPMALRNVGVDGSELPTPWHTLARIILKMKNRVTSAKNTRRPNFKSYPFYLSSHLNPFSQVCPFPNNHSANMKQKWYVHLSWLPTLAL